MSRELAQRANTDPGRLVVVCGVNGAGKTSLVGALAEMLPAASGREVVCTRQPTTAARDLPIFARYLYDPEARRGISYAALTAVMLGDRLQHVHEVVQPALKRGAIVLCDRYIYTMVAAVRARGYEYPWLQLACAEFPRPDVSLLIDVTFDIACSRITARPESRAGPTEPEHLKAMLNAFHELAHEGYFDAVYSSVELPLSEIAGLAGCRVLATLR